MDRWSEADASTWWAAHPWICGFNFLPSSAVNFLEMWHRDTFDRETIERELTWAAGIGFNAFRINPPYLIWKHDRDGLLERLDWIMSVAQRLRIATVPCLFDDCEFGGEEPIPGPQREPVRDVHNSRAVASPGRALLFKKEEWAGFEAYVRDVVSAFRSDDRILFWDLYNEPGNRMIFDASGYRTFEPDTTDASCLLMERSFSWARAEGPKQPITVAAWSTPIPGSGEEPYQSRADLAAISLSDILTFHAYLDTNHVRRLVEHLTQYNRPLLCTEWMARPIGSKIADQLAFFKSRNIGCFQWGLVQGRTQTHLPWPSKLVEAHGGHADRSVWFHDVLTADGQPYDASEIELIASLVPKRSNNQTI